MLKLENVTKSYNKNIIFNNVSLNFEKGLYILQGPNGSGKSTILRIITGLTYKDSGKIYNDLSISFLPDKYSLPKLISVKDYLYNFIDEKNKKHIYLEEIEKYQLPNKLLGKLSKGNMQKLGIIQTLLRNADCYIFDEPLDGLDSETKKVFKTDIETLIKNDKIVILSLHNKTLFNSLSPKLINIKDGQCNEKKKKL